MSSYLIDFENSPNTALSGKNKLLPADRVFVFYSEDHPQIPKNTSVCMTSNRAVVRYIKVNSEKKQKSYQISSYVGYLIATGVDTSIVIISNDPELDEVVAFWKNINPQTQIYVSSALGISPNSRESIAQSSQPSAECEPRDNNKKSLPSQFAFKKKTKKKTDSQQDAQSNKNSSKLSQIIDRGSQKKLRSKLNSVNLDDYGFSAFLKIFSKSKNKQELNIALVREFTQETGNRIYKAIVKDFDKYTKRNETKK